MRSTDSERSPLFGKELIKVLLVRPPSYLWPIINESDNFLLPLGFPCLAAWLREKMTGVQVEILDCPPLKIGWKKLERIVREKRPDVIGVGDMICYMKEGMRLVRLAKQIDPQIVTVGGGHFHSAMPDYSLSNYPELDFVIRWEGEEALRQLLCALRDGGDLRQVGNLAYFDGQQVVKTEPLPLIQPLDSLPIPAYDLTPIDKYAPFGMLWPRAITIQAQRGCPYKCNFCSWSYLEGEHHLVNGQEQLTPRIRAKSGERVLQEIDLLYNQYKIRYLFWVDATWNYDSTLMEQICGGILERGYKLGWWAFCRPDILLQQHESGVLRTMVDSGLSHVLLGAERETEEDLRLVGKTDARRDSILEVCHLLEREYPTVFRQATWMTGIPTETEQSLRSLGKYVRRTHLDFAAFHPLMPYPGTELWEQYKDSPLLEEKDFSKFDMFYPVMASQYISRKQIAKGTEQITLEFVTKQPLRYLRGMFSRIKIRRRLHWWFALSITRVLLLDLWHAILGRKTFSGFAAVSSLWKPSWYEK
ncbi:MAG: radical SAM protein [Candidatus Alcyoniella australis]|nr:radical SAM protein [Candidatus Alcyoniella australis]